MKLARTFLFWFTVTSLVVIALDIGLFSFSDFITQKLTDLVAKKTSAKSYPIAVFTLMLSGSIVELLLSYGIYSHWLLKIKERSQKKVVSIGAILLGAIVALTALAAYKGDIDDVKLGLNLAFIVTFFVGGPLFMVSVLHMLREPDANPKRARIIKWVSTLAYVFFALISILGIILEVIGT